MRAVLRASGPYAPSCGMTSGSPASGPPAARTGTIACSSKTPRAERHPDSRQTEPRTDPRGTEPGVPTKPRRRRPASPPGRKTGKTEGPHRDRRRKQRSKSETNSKTPVEPIRKSTGPCPEHAGVRDARGLRPRTKTLADRPDGLRRTRPDVREPLPWSGVSSRRTGIGTTALPLRKPSVGPLASRGSPKVAKTGSGHNSGPGLPVSEQYGGTAKKGDLHLTHRQELEVDPP